MRIRLGRVNIDACSFGLVNQKGINIILLCRSVNF